MQSSKYTHKTRIAGALFKTNNILLLLHINKNVISMGVLLNSNVEHEDFGCGL